MFFVNTGFFLDGAFILNISPPSIDFADRDLVLSLKPNRSIGFDFIFFCFSSDILNFGSEYAGGLYDGVLYVGVLYVGVLYVGVLYVGVDVIVVIDVDDFDDIGVEDDLYGVYLISVGAYDEIFDFDDLNGVLMFDILDVDDFVVDDFDVFTELLYFDVDPMILDIDIFPLDDFDVDLPTLLLPIMLDSDILLLDFDESV